MFRTKFHVSARKLILSTAVVSLTAAGLIIGAQFNSTEATAASPTAVFAANPASLGGIPDGPAACNAYGANRDVTFTVTGISGTVSNVAVNFTIAPAHTWVGDLDVRLIAPNAVEHVIFSRTGATTATGAGFSTDAGGPYTFADTAPASPTWWGAAATNPIPSGSYRTSTPGEVVGGGANTLMTPTFAALGGAANGTWTLRFRDHCSADVGTVSAANLTIDTTGGAADAAADFNGDGRTDYAIAKNVGGQIRWYIDSSGGGATQAYDWGLAASDFVIAEDFDGDLKDDISVWRSGSATVASFYILQSQTNTARVEAFGQTGDDPTVVGDYNGDGKADLAVYRAGLSAGAQSVWYYRTTANGPVTFIPWGVSGDFPAPGDYDGNGSNDFVVQRDAGGGQAAFWRRFSTGTQDVQLFGSPTDVIVPGDYDGDGKTDIATIRGIGSTMYWFYRPSGGGADVTYVAFGAAGPGTSDFAVQGDYNGDGRTDMAIWRAGTFWVRNVSTGAVNSHALGSGGDYPIANFNTH
jgi:hypothetical protein